jgi:hypothetical protein
VRRTPVVLLDDDADDEEPADALVLTLTPELEAPPDDEEELPCRFSKGESDEAKMN